MCKKSPVCATFSDFPRQVCAVESGSLRCICGRREVQDGPGHTNNASRFLYDQGRDQRSAASPSHTDPQILQGAGALDPQNTEERRNGFREKMC